MTFEEFFKKKRTDLAALEKAEPALFAEFKTHYEQMGEKSFDHTKKYWFNKTRRQFPLAPEIKTEKVHMENQLAEQTITETLTEPTAPDAAAAATPKMGFVPKFRAGNVHKPVISNAEEKKEESASESTPASPVEENPAAKPAYVPKFKMKPKVEVEETSPATDEVKPEPAVETPAEPVAAKPAYKPRFNMKTLPKKPEGE